MSIYILLSGLASLFMACSEQSGQAAQVTPEYNAEGNQIITKAWIDQNSGWIREKVRIKLKKEVISDTSTKINVRVYDVDPDLKLVFSPLRLKRDTILIDTVENKVIDHITSYYDEADTVRISFIALNDTLKPFWRVGLVYKKEEVFYYFDTSFMYSRKMD